MTAVPVAIAAPTDTRPGADVTIDVTLPAGRLLSSSTLQVTQVRTWQCGCRTLVLDRPQGGTVEIRVDNRPAESAGRCTREHLPWDVVR